MRLAFAAPELPPAARPVYVVGDTWIRNDGTYQLVRIENDVYVFTAGAGREVRLTKDLALARVERGGIFFEFDPPVAFDWPLKVGNWGETASTRRAVGNPVGTAIITTWKVEDVEEVKIGDRVLPSFRIRMSQRFPATGRLTVLTMWYAPDVQRLVKADGTDFETFKFITTGFTPPTAGALPIPPRPTLESIRLRPTSAEVKRVTAGVEIRRKGATSWTPANVGSRLSDGDEIKTTSGAVAELVLPHGNGLTIADETHVVVTKLESDPQTTAHSFLFHLIAGKVRADVVPADPAIPGHQAHFIISTHTGSAVVNGGATAVVTHEPATQKSFVAALPPAKTQPHPPMIRYIDLSGSGVVTVREGMFITDIATAGPSVPEPTVNLPQATWDALPLRENMPKR